MALKARTLEIPELMHFLRRQLFELTDVRKSGNNTKYQVVEGSITYTKDISENSQSIAGTSLEGVNASIYKEPV